MSGKIKTNYEKGSVAPLPYKRKVRLVLWGGAARPSDNFTFEHAKNKVLMDYKALDKNNFILIDKKIRVAKDIVDYINAQEDNNIRSLDIWTHGGPNALYLTTADPPPSENAPWYKRRLYEANRWGFHNSSLYRSRIRMVSNAAGWTEGSALLSDVNFAKFAANAKIEFHGCKTGADPQDVDNIAADFSQRLSDAGKESSAVIGHIENAEPLINGRGGKTQPKDQDYRYGKRAIFKHGKLVKVTQQIGVIAESGLEQ